MIRFNYERGYAETDDLLVKSDQGIKIRIVYDNGDPVLVCVDDVEFNDADDTLNGLFVSINCKPYALSYVLRAANEQIDAIIAENEQEAADELRMAQELSSPYQTGRI